MFGLLSALLYGASDFAARFASGSAGVLRTMFYGQCAVALALGAYLAFAPIHPAAALLPWTALLVGDAAILAATACLYRAIAIGRLAVVSPVTSCYGGIGAVLSLLSGEPATLSLIAGLAFVSLGAVLSAAPDRQGGSGRSGAGLAGVAAVLYGAGFWAQGRWAVPAFGALFAAWSYYASGAVALFGVAALRRLDLAWPSPAEAAKILILAALASAGYLALEAGQMTGKVAVATALSSLASAVTVVLACLFLRERVTPRIWSGLGAIVVGLVTMRL